MLFEKCDYFGLFKIDFFFFVMIPLSSYRLLGIQLTWYVRLSFNQNLDSGPQSFNEIEYIAVFVYSFGNQNNLYSPMSTPSPLFAAYYVIRDFKG